MRRGRYRVPRICRTVVPCLILLFLLLAGGCAPRSKPDLGRLYQGWAKQQGGRRPVVLIPGLMGSRLEDPATHRVMWGGLRELIERDTAEKLAVPLDPAAPIRLVPAGLVGKVAGVDVYDGIVTTLTTMGGYKLDAKGSSSGKAVVFPFAYDWRLSNARNAGRLARFIKDIQKRYGDPSLKVDIIAHSMGGLIARYYILYGGRNVLEDSDPLPDYVGARNVNKLVMLGTPNLGSVDALLACIKGTRVGLNQVPPEVFSTMPSMYELMPSPSLDVLYTDRGTPAPLDIYDVKTWKQQQWGIFDPALQRRMRRIYIRLHPGADEAELEAHIAEHRKVFARLLKRAEALHRALEAGPVPEYVQTLLLGGDCSPTRRALVVESEGGRWVLRETPSQVRRPSRGMDLWQLFYEPGDGTVTKSSLLGALPPKEGSAQFTGLPYAQAGFVCEQHLSLVKNWTFKDNLLHVLLYRPITPAEACAIPK